MACIACSMKKSRSCGLTIPRFFCSGHSVRIIKPMTQPSHSPPPHAALLHMILGKWVSSAISAAAHFSIADHLESGPKSPTALAAPTGTKEQPLYRLLRANASVGVFTELEDGRFAQTPLSDPLRTSAKPSIRHMAM